MVLAETAEVAPVASADTPPQVTADAAGVCVILDNQSTQVSDAAFIDAVGRRFAPAATTTCDAGSPAAPRVSVVYSPANRELTVTFSDAHGALTRVLEAPDDATEAPDMAALVALELSQRDAPAATPVANTSESGEPTAATPNAADSPSANPEPETPPPVPPRPRRFATAAFVYPLAVNYNQPDVHTSLDVNLIYGVVGEVEGVQLGTFNDVRGPVQGLQLGLLVNGVGETMRGASIGGVMSSAGSVNSGLQAAGVVTLSHGTTDGVQAAFFGNLTRGTLNGAQFAGALNISGGDSNGLQASALTNIAHDLHGAQLSLLGNYAHDVTGVQFGLVNIGNRVRGTQIGLVNIAKDVEGVPVGLVSISKAGGVHFSAWASSTNLANLGLRLGTRYTYSMFTFGYDREGGRDLFGPGFILGVRAPVVDKFAVDLDVGGDYLTGARFCCFEDTVAERRAHALDRSNFRLRVIPTWQPHPHFSVFAGGGIAVRVPFGVYSDYAEIDHTVTLGPEVLLGVSI